MNDNQATVQPVVELPDNKQTIINTFLSAVKGKKADTAASNIKHSGKEGHWLETAMGIAHNASNTPDILGYEMKNGTKSKTSFGDWSANYYIFRDPEFTMNRSMFLKIFGKPNAKKDGRHSWSGEPIPKIDTYNTFGQILKIVDGSPSIFYSFSKDTRPNKLAVVPVELQREDLLLAQWYKDSLKQKVEQKFNNKGWFKCEKDKSGVYVSIAFGDPITFDRWIGWVQSGDIFFDSGMYDDDSNTRLYSQWRANNSFWDKMVTERHS